MRVQHCIPFIRGHCRRYLARLGDSGQSRLQAKDMNFRIQRLEGRCSLNGGGVEAR